MKITDGSLALAALVAARGPAALARVVDCTPGALANWAAGRRSPNAKARAAIAQHFGVEPGTWDRTAPAKDGSARPRRPRRPRRARQAASAAPLATSPTPTLERLDPRHEAEQAVRRAKEDLAKLDADLKASPRERASAMSALVLSIKALAGIAGEPELTWPTIMRSPLWAAFEDRLEAALRPYPDAARAVVDALRAA
jgi:transcriptional regulator with XRE-family HTH domain